MLKTIFEVKAAVITKQFLFKPEKKDTKSGKELRSIFSVYREQYMCNEKLNSKYLSVFNPNAKKCRKVEDQNNSEYGLF